MAVNGTVAARVERLDRAAWDAITPRFADHNYRQTWEFGERAAARVGAVSEHVAVRVGTDTLALADVRIRSLPVVGGGLAYVTGGPLTRLDGDSDAGRLEAVVSALRREYVGRRGLLLRIVPPIGPPEWNRAAAEVLERSGFAPATDARSYRTMLVPIGGPLADVRKALHQKWRNCLNRAEREGLSVREAPDDASFDAFSEFFDVFVQRKGFTVALGPDFYGRVQRGLADRERFTLLLAERDGQLLSAHLSSALGDTMVYLLGATSPDALPCKAAYLLQWQAIERAHARGLRWYDVGGIDPDANPGVFHFKAGLGGEDVSAAPLECVDGLRARLVRSLEAKARAAQPRA